MYCVVTHFVGRDFSRSVAGLPVDSAATRAVSTALLGLPAIEIVPAGGYSPRSAGRRSSRLVRRNRPRYGRVPVRHRNRPWWNRPGGPADPDIRQLRGRIRTLLKDLVGGFDQARGGSRPRVGSGNPQTWWIGSLSIHPNRLSVRRCNEVRFFSDPVLEAAIIGSRQLGYSVNL